MLGAAEGVAPGHGDRVTRVGRLLVSEGVRRFEADGVDLRVIDPGGMLGAS